MQTVILCGGKGTRLAGETEYKPKPLVEIGGKPILWHVMKGYSHQGFNDFILCLGYKGNMIKEYFLNLEHMSNDFILDLKKNEKMSLSDHHKLDGKIIFADTGQETMTGSRVAKIESYLKNDNDFFLTYGDGVSDVDLHKLYEHHKQMGKVATITTVSPTYRFGLVESEGGLVKKFDEKPDMKDLVNGGFMVCNKKIFNYLSKEGDCILEQEPLKKLVKEGQLAAYRHKGFWQCMDNQKEVNELNEIWEKGAPWEIWKDE